MTAQPDGFTIDPDQFPLDLSTQVTPQGWVEDKWTVNNVYLRTPNGVVAPVPMTTLATTYGGEGTEVCGQVAINKTHGRQVGIGMVNPESTEGNTFTGLLYHERAGGGSTLIVAAQHTDGSWLVALLDQERPGMNQSQRNGRYKRIRQVPGGYPIEMAGTPDQIHRATAIAEGGDEILGDKMTLTTESLINLYSAYNSNNGYVLTGKGQGIATQLLVIPFRVLSEELDGTYSLDRDKAEVADRRLERIFAERFHRLDKNLLRTIHENTDGYAACAKTVIAVDRAYFYLILGV